MKTLGGRALMPVAFSLDCDVVIVNYNAGALLSDCMAVTVLRCLLRTHYRQCSAATAERMNRDLVFDHADVTHDLRFKPRPFQLNPEDFTH